MRLETDISRLSGERVIENRMKRFERGSWSAIVLAGTRPEGDPLAAHFGVPLKALVPVAGEPMIAHVIRALDASPSIGRIVVVAQRPELLGDAVKTIPRAAAIEFATSDDSIVQSLFRIAGTPTAPWPVLVTTADHPLLTADMVERFIAGSARSDIAIGVVDRQVLMARYPDSRRTWLRFRGGAYTGANLFAVRSPLAAAGLRTLAGAEADRKAQLKLLWRIGPGLALAVAARLLSLERAVAWGGRRLGLDAAAVLVPFAEAGIDVDRAEHQQLVDRILLSRALAR